MIGYQDIGAAIFEVFPALDADANPFIRRNA